MKTKEKKVKQDKVKQEIEKDEVVKVDKNEVVKKEKKKKKKEKVKQEKEETNDDLDDSKDDKKKDGLEESKDTEAEDATENKKRRKRKRKRKTNKDDNEEQQQEAAGSQHDDDEDDDMAKRRAELDRTVYLEGIPFQCSRDEVLAFFSSHGLKSDVVVEDCRLPVWQDSGRLRGFGHVVFTTPESKQRALALSGKYLKNRYLTIQEAQAPKQQLQEQSFEDQRKLQEKEPSRTLLLHNLSYEANEEDIDAVMKKFGPIATGGVRVVRHSQPNATTTTAPSKGFGYVEYESLESAQAAVQSYLMGGICILKRPCRVDYDHGRVKGSFRAANGKYWQREYGRKHQQEQEDNEESSPEKRSRKVKS